MLFGFALGVVAHRSGALGTIKANVVSFLPGGSEYQGEAELLQYAFTDPIIDREKLYPPITSLNGIYRANQSIFMNVSAFDDAYETLVLLGTDSLKLDGEKTKVLRVRFGLSEESSAYAYGEQTTVCGQGNSATLIIPGSGLNQSSGIIEQDPKNYHDGVMDALKNRGDLFVFIKPNEDILAFHDGTRKLNDAFVVNYHLNRGSSYSAIYLVQSLAMIKYLKSCYSRTIVAGLSQGGAAALLNALQSEPYAAIVSSGYSVINEKAEWSGFDQIIIPSTAYARLHDPAVLVEKLKRTPTKYLFTWGKEEKGTYRIEAEEQPSCKALETLPNVQCAIHDAGHLFPVAEIQSFLNETIGQQ